MLSTTVLRRVAVLSLVGLCTFMALACTRDRASPTAQTDAQPAPTADASATTTALAAPSDLDASDVARPVSAAHGAQLYARMCAVCHGAEGEGYLADQAPALAQPDFLATVSDEFLSFAIAVGRRGSTMSAWQTDHGGPLSPDDVRDVVAHLRSWQKQPALTPADNLIIGEAERGRRIFKQRCAQCHGAKAPYVHILNRQLLFHARPAFLRHAIQHGRPPTKMPAFQQALGDQAIEDVVAYLRNLPSWPIPGEVPGNAAPPPIPLGPVPLNPRGPEPRGFHAFPANTSVDVVGPALARGARMVLIDARTPSDYANSHIAGAVSIPFYDPSPYLDALPRDTWLVCYCGCPHAESSALAKQLVEADFRKVTVLDEGLGVWGEKMYPLRSGLAP
jgi:cytochrome c oxidase cbb3-type subunit 3/ubiquinol-cytochrome c reductase cytochrome c subunit